jgi:response regulator of citrate/malate metabolism
MRDMVGHDRNPSGFLVYLHLFCECEMQGAPAVRESHQTIAEATGLSKSAVQKAIRYLNGRKLLRTQKDWPTAVPLHRVLRTWRR